MKVVSAFDGISCGQLALQRAGIPVEAYISLEIDKHALKVARRNFPNTYPLGDVTKFNPYPEFYDLLIGGSPCQSFSRQGDQSGFDGKSGLFWEFVRILKEGKFKYFLLENVVMKKEWEDIITEALGVEPICLDSSLVSSQKRQRIFWTDIPNVTQPEDKGITLLDLPVRDRPVINDHPLIIDRFDQRIRVKNATKQGWLDAFHGDSINLEVPNSKTRRGRVGIGKTNTLSTSCNYGMNYYGDLVELTIEDYEWLQTLPQGYTEGISLNQRKKAIGNGWTVDILAHIFAGLKNNS